MRYARRVLSLLSLVFLAGCATPPKIDWTARVGSYTYDQTVLELGVPDKTAKLGDGTTVAEWLVRPRSTVTWAYSSDVYVGHHMFVEPPPLAIYSQGAYSGQWLRLVFAPDGKLRTWSRYER